MIRSSLIFLRVRGSRYPGNRAHNRLVGGEFADDLGLVSDDDVTLDQVLQFANIARPAVFLHAGHGVVGETWRLLCIKLAVLAQEEFQENRNLLPPFAKGRNVDRYYIQSVKKVFPERALLHRI